MYDKKYAMDSDYREYTHYRYYSTVQYCAVQYITPTTLQGPRPRGVPHQGRRAQLAAVRSRRAADTGAADSGEAPAHDSVECCWRYWLW